MPELRASDIEQGVDDWLDDAERRIRFFGWSHAQVARLYLACERELRERNVSFSVGLPIDS